MRTSEKDVLIIGAGCAGLWLAHELARSGFRTLLVEYGPLAQYASQRNQGWLHSGSLYAMIEASIHDEPELFQLAKTCLVASGRLKRFAKRYAPKVFDLKSRCLYLYQQIEESERPVECLRRLGLEPRIWRGDLSLVEPILKGSPVKVAIEAPDIPMNCGYLLEAVCRRALTFGAEVMQSKIPIADWQLERIQDRWVFRSDEAEIHSKIVVSAVGPLVNQSWLREQIFPETLPVIQRGVVGILHRRVCNGILVFRDKATDHLNLTPFPGLTTINLGGTDKRVNRCDRDEAVEWLEIDNIAQRLSEFCPSIACPAPGIPSNFYVCHKAANNLPGSHPQNRRATRHYFWRADPLGLGMYYIYSGKFTLGLSAAQSLARVIRDTHPTTRMARQSVAIPRRRSLSMIAPSPYHGMQTHYLRSGGFGDLEFRPRLM